MDPSRRWEPRCYRARFGSPRPHDYLRASPDELRTDLPDARITRIRDISEAAAADVPARIRELCVVENVEEFAANLERHRFLNGNDLRYSETGVVEARTVEESAIRRPETSAIRTGQNTRH
jgi:hypothetical protein